MREWNPFFWSQPGGFTVWEGNPDDAAAVANSWGEVAVAAAAAAAAAEWGEEEEEDQ